MSGFRTGKFTRELVHKWWRPVCPTEAVGSLLEIDPAALAARGKKLVLIDVDNTVLPWSSQEVPESSVDWVKRGREQGLDFCLISNTRHLDRLARLSDKLGVRHMVGKFKPSREMFLAALKEFGVQPEQAVMVGDQLFTDVLGANRTGIESIWVQPSTKNDFIGTKVNRLGERIVRKRLYQVLEEEDDDLPIVKPEGIFERRIVRQFAKFCIVGGSSFIIDASIRYVLMYHVPFRGEQASQSVGRWMMETFPAVFGYAQRPTEASVWVAATLSGAVAILNSFIWNRRWTFQIHGREERSRQLRRFVLVSVIGNVLNSTITTVLYSALPFASRPKLVVATLIATAVGAVWNFSGQRLWAFRKEQG